MKDKFAITYIIGTDDVDVGEDEIELIEPYRAELEERLRELFPEANVEVVIENGSSGAGVGGLDWETQRDQMEATLETINATASEVWNNGNWGNAPYPSR